MKIDFSKYSREILLVRRSGDLYEYELSGSAMEKMELSNPVPFEDLPQEIQERVAILLTAPAGVEISGVGERVGTDFFLKDH